MPVRSQVRPGSPSDIPLPVRFRVIQTPYYVITTDLPPEEAQEAALRMTRMAEEYAERTKGFSGRVTKRLPFYLFQDIRDYNTYGGPVGSAGVFQIQGNDRRLLAFAGEATNPRRWEVIQHEGFHQFADAAIGRLPPWIDEGLAEYFGEAIWTGDGFVTGAIPPERLKRLRARMTEGRLLAVRDMMQLQPDQWNFMISPNNYHQAWSMTQFLAHGDNGKYQAGFNNFMRAVNRKVPWEKAWVDTFGATDGFEPKWSGWYAKLPDDPTAELYTRATLSTIASFVARAHAERRGYRTLEDLAAAMKVGEFKPTGENWLPYRLLEEAVVRSRRDATTFSIEPARVKSDPPAVVAVRPDGTRLVATSPARFAVPVKVTITATSGAVAVRPVPSIAPPTANPGTPPAFNPPANAPGLPPATPARPPEPPKVAVAPPDASARPPMTPPVLVRPEAPAGVGPNLPAAGGPIQVAAGVSPGREKAVEFVAANNVFGPDHDVVAKVIKASAEVAKTGSNLRVTLGPKMMKSGRLTDVIVLEERCFVIEYTPQQRARIDIGDKTVMTMRFGMPPWTRTLQTVDQVTTLFTPMPLSADEPLKWKTKIDRSDAPDERPYATRVRYLLANGNSFENTAIYKSAPKAGAILSYQSHKMPKLEGPEPILAFVDVVHPATETDKIEILSNTMAFVLDVAVQPEGDPAAPAKPVE
ncbi:DUF1570 domain-containing protein [Humisphaera borealis]|uniref:DUF1570 domain-containing protein n=1 Tax=Humisphaera borealis TaxID=2807512 RepID=A0A7M2X2C2_9BACT|nr:DUF1570 domain-containing protein [Humisphaera borealis]QOV91845.1 DUF1570 domain-containing protein [Humisphaera borealis]